MNSTTDINLIDVRASISKHKRYITFVTLAAVIAGALGYAFFGLKYIARTEFILRNPLYGDRTVIYNSDRLYNYFANAEDVDKIILLSGTDLVQHEVIRDMGLATAYKIDTTDPVKEMKLEKEFDNNLKITRTEYGDVVITYRDADPKLAIGVANKFVQVLGNTFSDYYKDMRRGMYESILDKIHDADSAINTMTDTLISIRDRYGIYASKYNIVLNAMKDNTDKKYGRGVEMIQNIESAKDELVNNRIGQMSLINQYKTGLKNDQLPIIKVVTPAKIANRPGIVEGILKMLICGALGFFFSILTVLFSDRYIVKNKRTSLN